MMLSAKAFRAGMLGVLEEQGGVAANVTQEGTEREAQVTNKDFAFY